VKVLSTIEVRSFRSLFPLFFLSLSPPSRACISEIDASALPLSFSTAALQEFVLTLAQHPKGGLRDKPPKFVVLSPLSSPLLSLFSSLSSPSDFRFSLSTNPKQKRRLLPHRQQPSRSLLLPTSSHPLPRPIRWTRSTMEVHSRGVDDCSLGSERRAEERRVCSGFGMEGGGKTVFELWRGGEQGREFCSAPFEGESRVEQEETRKLTPFFFFFCALPLSFGQNTTHPAINILLLRAEPMMRKFYQQENFTGKA